MASETKVAKRKVVIHKGRLGDYLACLCVRGKNEKGKPVYFHDSVIVSGKTRAEVEEKIAARLSWRA